MEREQPEQPSEEEQLVAAEMRRALEEDGEISDTAARIVASWWHGGQASALYSFVSTGAIDADGLRVELAVIHAHPATGEQDRSRIDFLAGYLMDAKGTDDDGNRGPIAGWHEATRW